MNHSSRNTPCPCCHRDVDDKCRWNDYSILCYFGDSFCPPKNLNLHDSLNINGELWFLRRMDAGFASNSYLFIKASEDSNSLFARQRRNNKKEIPAYINWLNEFNEIRDLVKNSFSAPAFKYLDDFDFLEYKQATEKALEKTKKLLSLLMLNKRYVNVNKFTIAALDYWKKNLQYHQSDFFREAQARRLLK